MISDHEFIRLCEIDKKMFNDKPVTQKEREERLSILFKMNQPEQQKEMKMPPYHN